MNARPAPMPSLSSPLPRPARRRANPGPLGLGIPLLSALLLGVLLLALGACSPTVGEDGVFDPQPTTNADFTLPASTVTVGNQPITMDYTTTLGVLDLVAVVNSVADIPLDADGNFIPTGSVSILRNNPPGTITEVTRLDTLQFPSKALWADLDGTGDLDLVVLDNLNEHVAVYVSTVVGVWPTTPTQEFAFTDTVAQMEIVSLDGVGGDDVVMTLPTRDLIVALVNTAGTLAQVDTSAVTGLGRFVAERLNAGTTIDLAILRTGSNFLEIYEGDGLGSFTQTLPSTSIAVDANTIALVAGDLTGGPVNVDLALLGETANADLTYVRLYANDGAGLFTLSGTTTLPTRGYRIFLADTGLGTGQDVAVVHRNDRILSFLGANGTGFDATQLTTTRDPIDVVAGKVNGTNVADTTVDLVTAEDDRRTIGVFEGDGVGGFTRTQIGLTTHVVFPRLVDVDGDLVLDLIVLHPYLDQLAVFINAN